MLVFVVVIAVRMSVIVAVFVHDAVEVLVRVAVIVVGVRCLREHGPRVVAFRREALEPGANVVEHRHSFRRRRFDAYNLVP